MFRLESQLWGFEWVEMWEGSLKKDYLDYHVRMNLWDNFIKICEKSDDYEKNKLKDIKSKFIELSLSLKILK